MRTMVENELRTKAELAIGLEVGESTVTRLTVTGEPYITLTNGGYKAEGSPFPIFSDSRERAIAGYLGACQAYKRQMCDNPKRDTSDPAKVLYWRSYPSILEFDGGTWAVYSRMLISDKPVITDHK